MYTVPVIPPDLRHEETIIQATCALDCLHSTITNIFDRIDKRISKNNVKINELSSRINTAALKIKSLSGTNKAIKIFSPAKFPSAHAFRDIELTFKDADSTTAATLLNNQEISSRVDLGPNNIQDKLLFFHYRSPKNISPSAGVSYQNGLGDIPSNVKSINSILLFSTAENVFGARKTSDEIIRVQRKRSKDAKKPEIGTGRGLIIEPAPLSLSNRQKGADKRLQQGLFYTPKLNEAPTIDLPADLKDLPGIADDIQFEFAETHQIAPSLFFENLTDMSNIIEIPDAKNDNPVVHENIEPVSLVISSSTPAAPPPPPPQVKSVPKPIAPPPPPPPPPLEAGPISSKEIPSPPPAPSTDVRSNLMDAIRKAGGAKGGRLRAAADVARQTSTEKLDSVPDKPKINSGGDLMADLHNKLLMRRKGISGAKDGERNTSAGGDVISRLSALIPPPPIKVQNSSSDEDAGDDADWAD